MTQPTRNRTAGLSEGERAREQGDAREGGRLMGALRPLAHLRVAEVVTPSGTPQEPEGLGPAEVAQALGLYRALTWTGSDQETAALFDRGALADRLATVAELAETLLDPTRGGAPIEGALALLTETLQYLAARVRLAGVPGETLTKRFQFDVEEQP